MSVLIRGMKMPSGCISCDLCNTFTDEPYCRRLMRKTPKATRLKDCPLVEIPTPHGRLIDGEKAKEELRRAEALTRAFGYHNVIETISEVPTIIEAEEGEQDESFNCL